MKLQKEFEQQGNWLFRKRGWLPIIILIPGILLFGLQQLHMAALSSNQPGFKRYEIGCLMIGLVGLIIRIYTVGYSHANTSGRNTKQGQVAETLNATGIYSIVRHPLYLGNFLMWFSIALLVQHTWFMIVFILFFCLYYERIMFAEEQFLERKFGKQFTTWADHVPAFIPHFGKFVKPDCSFSWKKVLRAEKNGLFGLFLVFFVFDVTGVLIRGDNRYNYVLMFGCIGSTILYLVLKFLKYKTKILDV